MSDGGLERSSNRRAILGAALLATTTMAGVAFSAPAQAQATAARSFDIPAQPLPAALTIFGRQSGLQVSVPAALANGRTSSAVLGNLTPLEALSRLLTGTGLVYRISGNIVTLEPAPQSADGAIQLGPVRVEGATGNSSAYSASLTSDPAATEGTGSYTTTGPSTTATGLGLTLRETPQSITIITRQKMDDFNQQNLKDVLTSTPGIYTVTQGDEIQFWARGGVIQNFQVDGGRTGQSHTSTGAGNSTNFVLDDVASYDRIEVLKGSAGLLQGDGYPTATVNMIRKRPTRQFQADIGVSAGSWNTYRADADISGPITASGNIRARAVLAYKDADSFKDNVSNRNFLAYGTLDFDISSQTLLNVGIEYKYRKSLGGSAWETATAYATNASNYVEAGHQFPLVRRSWNGAAPWSGYNQSIITGFASIEHSFSDDWKFKLRASHDRSDIPDWKLASLSAPFGSGGYANLYKDMISKTTNFNAEVKGNVSLFGREHEIIFGADITHNRYQLDRWQTSANYRSVVLAEYLSTMADPELVMQDGGEYFPEVTGESELRFEYRTKTIRRGVFATIRFNILDDLKLITGARISDYIYDYTWHNVYQGADSYLVDQHIREKRVITPYAGAVYNINKNISLYASYASVFQPITLQDENGATLKPQKGETYEIGSKTEFFDGRFNLSVSYFWKRWASSYERSGGVTPTGEVAYRNVNGVMERGYELEFSGELVRGLQIQGGYVMNNSSLNGSAVGEMAVPKHQVKLNGTYQLPGSLDNIYIGAGARWQSEIYAQNAYAKLSQPSYILADAFIRTKVGDKISISANVNNIFDKKYFSSVWTNGYSYGGLIYHWGEPRNANLTLRYKF